MSQIKTKLGEVYTRLKNSLKKLTHPRKQEVPALAWIPLPKKNNNRTNRF